MIEIHTALRDGTLSEDYEHGFAKGAKEIWNLSVECILLLDLFSFSNIRAWLPDNVAVVKYHSRGLQGEAFHPETRHALNGPEEEPFTYDERPILRFLLGPRIFVA